MNEDRLLAQMGLPRAERYQIEGLQMGRSPAVGVTGLPDLTSEQLSRRALLRLATDPPPEVGDTQRRTAGWLLRSYPLGSRVSGANMSPLPGWLAGAQSVCLNMSKVDLPVMLHFALFNGSVGYLLKPPEMRADAHRPTGEEGQEEATDADAYWPPPREKLQCISIEVLSLHNLPKRGEVRPSYCGSRSACHSFVSELSGAPAPPPRASDPSQPVITLELHPIGGFCALSKTLPLPHRIDTEMSLEQRSCGINAIFVGETVHCVAAEPNATFLRVSVGDEGHEVAYEIAVLGRLKRGYRVLMLRSAVTGTRIELCYLLVRKSFVLSRNRWTTPRQLRVKSSMVEEQWFSLDEMISKRVKPHLDEAVRLKEELAELRQRNLELERQHRSTPPNASASHVLFATPQVCAKRV